jgi:beta-1,4-mannosyl-glycoprotein beta-1,4-N-acetylglucosaminyltransferase
MASVVLHASLTLIIFGTVIVLVYMVLRCGRVDCTSGNSVPKIIDAFTFYNELDMLEIRLSELYDVVDFFVLVEATETHQGASKPLHFDQNKTRFKKYSDKIVHVVCDTLDKYSGSWEKENAQRNAILKGLLQLNLANHDVVFVCDVDEMTDRKAIHSIAKSLATKGCAKGAYALPQDFYYYNPEMLVNEEWTLARAATYDTVLERSPQGLRMASFDKWPEKAGWHLSYFGGPEFIQNKIKNFAHAEFNHEGVTDIDAIKERLSAGGDVLGRQDFKLTRIHVSDNAYPPPQKVYDLFPAT